ncbi:MAG: long-chain fatty acid--CoA ligase [Acetobacteraceae bacterium]|nr:long-chain fatty acid--CoA ligase [Acetobacteraceae bacterium]
MPLNLVGATGSLPGRFIQGPQDSIQLSELIERSSFACGLEPIRGRSVLIATRGQLTAAVALMELDGIARRLILCPANLSPEDVSAVMAIGSVDCIVSDKLPVVGGEGKPSVVCGPVISPARSGQHRDQQTEWVLLTSGTTGAPKLVVHTLQTLTAPIVGSGIDAAPAIWSTFYDIRRYGGLQILLRALLGGGSLVLSSDQEPIENFLKRAAGAGVTHISGTPTHWRRALMSGGLNALSPRYVRLSGEIADQQILDRLRSAFPSADIAHAFASTEAGVAFAVGDGRSGFPASFLGRQAGEVEIEVVQGSLRIRSPRIALRYLDDRSGAAGRSLTDSAGFVDTGDLVQQHDNRCYFVGRRDGVINVGGLKAYPEEIEAVINRHPGVCVSVVRGQRNAITGALVVADVVAASDLSDTDVLRRSILDSCRGALAPHKVPAVVRFVPHLDIAATGKLVRL